MEFEQYNLRERMGTFPYSSMVLKLKIGDNEFRRVKMSRLCKKGKNEYESLLDLAKGSDCDIDSTSGESRAKTTYTDADGDPITFSSNHEFYEALKTTYYHLKNTKKDKIFCVHAEVQKKKNKSEVVENRKFYSSHQVQPRILQERMAKLHQVQSQLNAENLNSFHKANDLSRDLLSHLDFLTKAISDLQVRMTTFESTRSVPMQSDFRKIHEENPENKMKKTEVLCNGQGNQVSASVEDRLIQFKFKAEVNLFSPGEERPVRRVQTGSSFPCIISNADTFSSAFNHYAKSHRILSEHLQFYFENEVLSPKHGPKDVKLKQGDIIYVRHQKKSKLGEAQTSLSVSELSSNGANFNVEEYNNSDKKEVKTLHTKICGSFALNKSSEKGCSPPIKHQLKDHIQFVLEAEEDLFFRGIAEKVRRVTVGKRSPCFIPKKHQFASVFDHYARSNRLLSVSLEFCVGNNVLKTTDTPESVPLNHGDIVFVRQRKQPTTVKSAFCEQGENGNKEQSGTKEHNMSDKKEEKSFTLNVDDPLKDDCDTWTEVAYDLKNHFRIIVKAEENLYFVGMEKPVCRVQAGSSCPMLFSKEDTFASVFNHYAKSHRLLLEQLQFSINDKILTSRHTLKNVELKNGEIISVRHQNQLKQGDVALDVKGPAFENETQNKTEIGDSKNNTSDSLPVKHHLKNHIHFVFKAEEDLFYQGIGKAVRRVHAGSKSPSFIPKLNTFASVFHHYAKSHRLLPEQLQFYFGNQILKSENVPEEVQLKHDDIIFVRFLSEVEEDNVIDTEGDVLSIVDKKDDASEIHSYANSEGQKMCDIALDVITGNEEKQSLDVLKVKSDKVGDKTPSDIDETWDVVDQIKYDEMLAMAAHMVGSALFEEDNNLGSQTT